MKARVIHMSMLCLYLQFTNINFLPVFTLSNINVFEPVLAFTKPIPNGLLAWHMTLPNHPHLGYRVNFICFGECSYQTPLPDMQWFFSIKHICQPFAPRVYCPATHPPTSPPWKITIDIDCQWPECSQSRPSQRWKRPPWPLQQPGPGKPLSHESLGCAQGLIKERIFNAVTFGGDDRYS